MREGKKTLDMEHLKNLGLNAEELGREFGISGAGVKRWFKDGVAPYWTLIAAEGLARRMKGNSSVDSKVIRAEVSKQHKEAKKKDKSINNTSIKIKIDQVTILIKEHAIKGNDIRLLLEEETENADDKLAIKNKEYRKISNQVRQSLKELPQKEVTKLIEQFIPKEEENDE